MIDLVSEISLDRNSGSTITRQLIEGIRKLVNSGRLREGDKLPSTRDAAAGLRISRNIVAVVYDQLTAEGYLAPRKGAGTFVAAGAFALPDAVGTKSDAEPRTGRLRSVIRFNAGNPDLSAFPVAAWANTLKRAAMSVRPKDLGYASVQGLIEFRRELAAYLFRTRGVACPPERIVVISGLSQGLLLLAGICGRSRRRVILEDPALEYVGAAFERSGCELLPVPADEAGLRAQELPPGAGAELLYVVPTHQYPLGGILPIQRRRTLVSYARREDLWILEDD
jgi:GntR family transcriptional regulator/MocR family aminotransferase